MKTTAAVLHELGGEWSVEEIDLDPPKAGEVLVAMGATGLCHSDAHLTTGHMPTELPVIGGHEGAGTVIEVGPDVKGLKAGDRIVLGFIPSCGQCEECAHGRQNLCVLGAHIAFGRQISDGGSRHHTAGVQDLSIFCVLGAFARHTVVSASSCIKIDEGISLDLACLVSCGVITGWGAAVNAGGVRAGDTVVVVGVGGVGVNAVQGAVRAGATKVIAVDPVEFKREKAIEFGATHTATNSEEAIALVTDLTKGRGANVVVNTAGEGTGDQIGKSLAMAGKGGTVVVTNLHAFQESSVQMSALDLTLMEKRVVGSLFGSSSPRRDIPRFLDMYKDGHLKLDQLVTSTYKLDDINQAFTDLHAGRNLRGVITF